MSQKKIPLRRCTGCGQMKPKKELMRIVCGDGQYSPDPTGKRSGRGAYVCRNEECLNKAQKSRGLERSFKGAVPKEVYAGLRQELGAANE